MNILVLNGSPSGSRGVTSQYIKYLEQQFPMHVFRTVEVARSIRRLERDKSQFDALVQEINEADAILWCFPVYFMLVPAQLKRFIELLFERTEATTFDGKIATAISTSAHFYDHTAHDYLQGVCSDLGFAFVRGYSAGMDDLFSDEQRKNFVGFARDFFRQVAEPDHLMEVDWPSIRWSPQDLTSVPLPTAAPKTGDKKIVVISDAEPDDHNLQWMIELFDRSVSHPVDRLELRQLKIAGGCLGCMHCADGGDCVYKDEYADAFLQRVKPADVVIYAGAVRDRYLSARFKAFIDRYFSNGHRPVLNAGLFGVIISGPLSRLAPLRETLEASIELGGQQRLDIVSDDHTEPEIVASRLQRMARAMERWAKTPWRAPATFLGVGGHKVFRDIVYDNKGIMSADHHFYRTRGLYDFPQTNLLKRIFNRSLLICKRIPLLEKHMEKMLRAGRIKRYYKVLGE